MHALKTTQPPNLAHWHKVHHSQQMRFKMEKKSAIISNLSLYSKALWDTIRKEIQHPAKATQLWRINANTVYSKPERY